METRFQDRDTILEGLELRDIVLHGAEIGLDCGRRVFPVLGRKRKRPCKTVRDAGRLHIISGLLTKGYPRQLLYQSSVSLSRGPRH